MSYISLTERFSKQIWKKDWFSSFDVETHFNRGNTPSASIFPEDLKNSYLQMIKVVSAIADYDSDEPKNVQVSQLEVNQYLDLLEDWSSNSIVQQYLTWKPTALGQAKALYASAQDEKLQESAMSVFIAYPHYWSQIFKIAMREDPNFSKSHSTLENLFLVEQAPVVKLAEEKPSLIVKKDVFPAKSNEKTDDNSVPVPDVSEPITKEDEVAQELIKTLSSLKSSPDSFVSSYRLAAKTTNLSDWEFFENHFLKALVSSSLPVVTDVTKNWPPLFKMSPENPVDWVDKAKLWVTLRDGNYANGTYLLKEGFSKIINTQIWGNDIKLKMLSKILPFTAKSKAAFNNRLSFWISLGGDLDASCERSLNDSSLLGASNAREWILNSNNDLWNKELSSNHPLKREVHKKFIRTGAP